MDKTVERYLGWLEENRLINMVQAAVAYQHWLNFVSPEEPEYEDEDLEDD